MIPSDQSDGAENSNGLDPCPPPAAADAGLAEEEENLTRYVALMLRVYDRVRADPQDYARLRTLTASSYRPTIQPERSNPT